MQTKALYLQRPFCHLSLSSCKADPVCISFSLICSSPCNSNTYRLFLHRLLFLDWSITMEKTEARGKRNPAKKQRIRAWQIIIMWKWWKLSKMLSQEELGFLWSCHSHNYPSSPSKLQANCSVSLLSKKCQNTTGKTRKINVCGNSNEEITKLGGKNCRKNRGFEWGPMKIEGNLRFNILVIESPSSIKRQCFLRSS